MEIRFDENGRMSLTSPHQILALHRVTPVEKAKTEHDGVFPMAWIVALQDTIIPAKVETATYFGLIFPEGLKKGIYEADR